MSILDGTQIIWDGEVHITNATDISTGVLTLVLTPKGGVGALPALTSGPAGPPPVIDSVTVTSVNPGTTLPAPVWTLVSPGGAGVASHYTLAMSVYKGDTGLTGPSTNILAAPDVDVTTVAPTNGFQLVYNSTSSKMMFAPQLCGPVIPPATINDTSGNATSRTLASITIPSQKFAYRVIPSGQSVISGTVNTRVDLVARIANATTGDQCGYGLGLNGPTDRPTLIDCMPAGSATGYATIAAGAPATIYLQAEQRNTGTTDSWTTSHLSTNFQVQVSPIPPT
jgi:hypothetical protein